uniref:DUF2268 domain-containing protein n=1 Tax=Thermogemmatispora argillosa TaxID=2045280 RepID=A0A455T8S1_9CHLR|nr:hypothetical protein KTA_40450 [Thermogemmatispora argillosa]
MSFPYERYRTLLDSFLLYYPRGYEQQAQHLLLKLNRAAEELGRLLNLPLPELEIILVAPTDWEKVPHDEDLGKAQTRLPYFTNATEPPSLVVPTQLDPIIGEPTAEKLAFLLYHELAYAFLEQDPRPWPEDYPLWADEWQLQFAALWLSHRLDGQQDVVNRDLHELYAEIFLAEDDGKTPVTIRSFSWDEETSAEDYLCFDLLLERFALDLLKRAGPEVLPRFLREYRKEQRALLSDEVTAMLGAAIGPDGVAWLESLPYF